MTYTANQMNQAVAALVKAIPGLQPDVARAWVTAEQGVNYNILGVTYTDSSGKQRLYSYSSWDQGAQAAAHLIATGPYGGVRAALKTGSSQKEAAAIIASPWNHPYYSGTSSAVAGLQKIAGNSYAPTTPVTSGTSNTPTATNADFKLPDLNPLDAVNKSMTDVATSIQETGVWFAFFLFGAMLFGFGVFLLAKGPAENAMEKAGPIVAAAA